jgi:cytochrome c-type biogenesis protein CcmF
VTAGTALLALTLGGALVAASAWTVSARAVAGGDPGRPPGPWVRAAVSGTVVAAASAVAAVILLEVALLRQDTSWPYVERVAGADMSAYYRLTALWSALEGSLLLWLLALALVTLATLLTTRRLAPCLRSATLGVLTAVVAMFAVVTLLASPFVAASGEPGSPSPLLRDHVAMGVHPPLLYAGFAALAVPYALSYAALWRRRTPATWVSTVRAWNLVAWTALTASIALGAWWSYAVLGWGGYWAWDPVENASLLPWIASTALLHTVGPRTRVGGWRTWAVVLAGSGFLLVVLAQLVTRSGIVESVHAFTTSSIGPAFAAVLTLLLAPWLVLVVRRGRAGSASRVGAAPGRQRRRPRVLALEGQRMLLVVVLVVVVVGTLLPAALLALTGERVSVGPPWYHRTLAPFALALLALLAAAPWLSGRRRRPSWWPSAAVGALTCCVVGLTARDAWLAVVAGLASFAVVAALPVGPRADRHAVASWLAHTGFAVGAVAVLAGSHGSVAEDVLPTGGTLAAGGTTVTLVGLERSDETGHEAARAELVLGRDGEHAGSVTPELRWYPEDSTMLAGPEIVTGPLDDVYVTLLDADVAAGTAAVRLAVTPLVGWLWCGVALAVAGGTLALLPRRRRRARPPSTTSLPLEGRRPARVAGAAVPALALLALVLGGCAPPVQQAEPAPPLAGPGLDGGSYDVADLRGKVVLVAAWASWCGPCRDEMPLLADAHDELGDDGLEVLGVNVRDLPEAAQDFADEHGATFPSIVDERGTRVVAWGMRGVPASYLVDREGRLVERHPGPVTQEWIDEVVVPEVRR